mgnify:CR=1 FL=1
MVNCLIIKNKEIKIYDGIYLLNLFDIIYDYKDFDYKNDLIYKNAIATNDLYLAYNILKYGIRIPYPGNDEKEDMKVLGRYLKDVVALNPTNFRIFGPDEALSNRLYSVFEVTKRQFEGKIYEDDELLSTEGRIIDSMLSEHVCEGLLEGYLLTGRHGIFHSYESFMRIVDSMISQHAKWLKVSKELSWR